MKKILFLLLLFALVLGLCSCKASPHRKLQFDDGESHCFKGGCAVYDEYIRVSFGMFDVDDYGYFSIDGRSFTITTCECENIK